MRGGFNVKIKYLFLLAISGTVITLDQLIKIYIHTHFRLHESINVIPGFFNLTYIRNPGAAFGLLAESHPTFREIFFLIIPPLAIVFIVYTLKSTHEKFQIFALSLICGGALGNYIDRLNFGYVIDFLDFYIKDAHYPAFNVADMAIVSGVAIMTIAMICDGRKRKRASSKG